MAELDTFPIMPHRVETVSPEFSTTTIQMENGWEQRCANWKKPRRTFALSWTAITIAEYKSILDFFIDKKGAWKKFYFVNKNHVYKKAGQDGYEAEVTANTYVVRFKEDYLQPEYINSRFVNLRLELVETF